MIKLMHSSYNFKNWQKKKILLAKEHQYEAFEKVNELVFNSRNGKEITLVDGTKLVEFLSCSYLGLDMDPRVIAACNSNINSCGVTFSAARTRILAESFTILEDLLDKIFCNKYSVLFQSLHLTHLGIIPLIASGEMPSYPISEQGIGFILDKKAHASIQINRGLMSQFGEIYTTNFNNTHEVESLFQYIAKQKRTPLALADSIGSMGGITPIKELLSLAELYNGYVYLDDAHGTSIFGNNGCGYVLELLDYDYHPKLVLTSSLAKAFGTVGGVVILPTLEDRKMVKRFASTYIFGGPLPLSIVDASIASAKIHLSDEISNLQFKLFDNIQYFDSLMENVNEAINFNFYSPIRGIKVGDEYKAIQKTLELRKFGYAVNTSMYPTVSKSESILRITLSAVHTKEQIKDLCFIIKNHIL